MARHLFGRSVGSDVRRQRLQELVTLLSQAIGLLQQCLRRLEKLEADELNVCLFWLGKIAFHGIAPANRVCFALLPQAGGASGRASKGASFATAATQQVPFFPES